MLYFYKIIIIDIKILNSLSLFPLPSPTPHIFSIELLTYIILTKLTQFNLPNPTIN